MYTYTTVIYKHYQRTQCTEKKKTQKEIKEGKRKEETKSAYYFQFFFSAAMSTSIYSKNKFRFESF